MPTTCPTCGSKVVIPEPVDDNSKLKELIEWIHEKRNVHNYPHYDQIVKKATELLNRKP